MSAPSGALRRRNGEPARQAYSQSSGRLEAGRLMTRPISFGALLRKRRQARGLTLRELGRLVEVDHAYLWRLEHGAKTAPSAVVIWNLARVLQTDVNDFVALAALELHVSLHAQLHTPRKRRKRKEF
jgi:hypothetical protein